MMNLYKPISRFLAQKRLYSSLLIPMLLAWVFLSDPGAGMVDKAVLSTADQHEDLAAYGCDPDTLPPVIYCPPPAAISCESGGDPGSNPDLDKAHVVDLCDPDPDVTFEDEENPDFCQGGSFIRTWTATDQSGNMAQCEQVITVEPDREGPSIEFFESVKNAFFPNDTMIVSCDDLPEFEDMTDWVQAEDNCDDEPEIIFVEIPSNTPSCIPGLPESLQCVWYAVDNCGNESERLVVTLIVVDEEPPVIECPPAITIDCGDDIDPATNPDIMSATATDNCDDNPTITFMDSGQPDVCKGGAIIRTWTATDGCGNEDSCEQRIIVAPDTEPPVITLKEEFQEFFPNGVLTLGCNDPLPDFGDMPNWVDITDNCDDTPDLHFDDLYEKEPWFWIELGIVARWVCIWRAIDDCGNESEFRTEIHIVDNTPPELDCPGPVTVDCGADLNPNTNPDLGFPEVSDDCDENPSLSYEDTSTSILCGEQTIVRTWTATDQCENSSTCTQIITVLPDPEPLIIVDCPDGDDLGCNPDELPEPDPDGFIVRENCRNDLAEFNGKLYALSATSGSWADVRAEALAAGGDLVAVNDAAEEDFLLATFGGTERFWIGLTDQDVEGTFVWSNGDPLTYTNWVAGEPNNSMPPPEGEDFVVMNWNSPGVWNDFSSGRPDFPAGGVRGIIELPTTDLVTVSVETIRNDTIGCTGTLIYRYTATDICGFSVSCDQTYTYTVDNTPPTIDDCPQDIDLGCNPTTIPPPPQVTASDNCEVVDIRMTTRTTEMGCVRMITHRWVAVDACGNVSEPCEQKITYTVDKTPPVIICAPGEDLGCNPAELPGADNVEVSDGCETEDNPITVIIEVVRDDTIGCLGTLHYRYTAIDFCDNRATCDQIYTYTVDNTPPTIDQCPKDLFFNCGPVEIPEPPLVTGSDNCGVPTINPASSIAVNGCVETTTRTWVAVDGCGNQSEVCTQVITVVLDDGELQIDCPPGGELECNPTELPEPDPDAVTVSNNCNGPTFEHNGHYYMLTSTFGSWDQVRAEAVALGGELVAVNNQAEQDFLSATFGAEGFLWIGLSDRDSEGNFQWSNGDAFTYSNWLAGEPNNFPITPEGEDFVVMNWDGIAGGWNDWDNNQVRGIVELTTNPLTVEVEIVRHDTTGCLARLVYRYTATDLCGNTASCRQRFTYQVDNAPPVAVNCPQDLDLGWNPTSIPDAPEVDFEDNCEIVEINMTADTLGDDCDRMIIRRWTATDACGNVSEECVQRVTWQTDTEPPVIECPGDLDLGWNPNEDEIPPFTKPEVSDNCSDPDEISITGWEEFDQDGCLRIITRTWYAEDRCGNRDTCVQRIEYIFDETPPVFIDCPEDIDLGCNPDSTDIPPAVTPMVTDNCSDVEVVFSERIDTAGCKVLIRRIWRATDGCENTAICRQDITYTIDTIAPIIDPLVDEIEVQCRANDPDWSPMDLDLSDVVVINDNCSEVVVEVEDRLIAVGDCEEGGFLEQWECLVIASDLCGNRDSFVFIVTVIDTIPPVFMGEVQDTTVSSCADIPPPPDVKATDECSVSITYHEDTEGRQCLGDYTLIRVWIATDGCGNESRITQRVFVRDETPPVLTFKGRLLGEENGGERTINCLDLDYYLNEILVMAMDDCDPGPVLWLEHEIEDFEECQEDGASRRVKLNFTAMDDCGNSANLMFFLRLVDNTPPVLVGVPPDTCATSLPPAPIVKATDDCSRVGVSVKMTQDGPFDCANGWYYKRTWTATDFCGNTTMAMQRITISDGVAPQIAILNAGFEGAMDGDTIAVPKDCDGELLVPELKIITFDACSQTIRLQTELENLGRSDEDPVQLIRRVLVIITATDLCGNSTTLRLILEIMQTDIECSDDMPPSVKPRVDVALMHQQQVISDPRANPEQSIAVDEPVIGYQTETAVPVDTRIYPNPAAQQFFVDVEGFAGQRGTIHIYNIFGQLIEQRKFDELPATPVGFDSSQFAAGIYQVVIAAGDNHLQVHSLVIGRL